ncbi:MAG: CHAT domain-containing protein [Streptosporangiales bacterium]|nr:CHAT domain-containing protein [Streptosporangiales bacterium]
MLMSRYGKFGAAADRDEALRLNRLSLRLYPIDHPDRAGHLFNLGHTLLKQPDPAVVDEAMAAFRDGARTPSGSPVHRIQCGSAWADLAMSTGQWAAARSAWHEVFEQLPLLIDHRLARADRQRHLHLFDGVGPRAALARIDEGDVDGAWAALEQARGVLFGQALELRADTAELRRVRPDLAAEVDRLRGILNTETAHPAFELNARPAPSSTARREAAQQWRQLLATIRATAGLDRFALPPTPDQLREAGAGGLVVAVNVTTYRCDALTLTESSADVVPLPDLTERDARAMVDRFLPAVHGATRSSAAAVLTQVLAWLWDSVTGPVLRHLGVPEGPAEDAAMPRVWWIPTGPLSVLPVHASALDRVVSSYTPTVRALHHARRPAVPGGDGPLVVGINEVPDHRPLQNAVSEAEFVAATLPGSRPPVLDGAADRRTILDRLPASDWAHFACHAMAMPDPAESHLVLHDGPLPVRELTGQSLDHARLAYLSACTTAFGGTSLADESIHIASAFQIAGFPHVVGTLWPIADTAALEFARHIYGQLNVGTDPALAVHRAVHAVRNEVPERPHLWAAHVHFGP